MIGAEGLSGHQAVAEVEAEGEVHGAVLQVVVVLGVEAEGQTAVAAVFEGQFGGDHAAFRLGKIGAVPAYALEEIAAPGGYELMPLPVASLHQHAPCSAPEGLLVATLTGKLPVERELRPQRPSAFVGHALGGRDVLVEKERRIHSHGSLLPQRQIDPQSHTFVEERLDAGVERRELSSPVAAKETERHTDLQPADVAPIGGRGVERQLMAAAQGETLLLGLPWLEEILPVEPGVHAPPLVGAQPVVGEDLHALLLVGIDIPLAVQHGLEQTVGQRAIERTHHQAEMFKGLVLQAHQRLPGADAVVARRTGKVHTQGQLRIGP